MSRVVLIVEDAETCRATIEIALLKVRDIVVASVASGEEALTFLTQTAICALITDLHLPRMDGFELIEQVRKQPNHARVPILVISGDSDSRTAARIAQLGANAYFPKPYSPAEVRHKLEQLINVS